MKESALTKSIEHDTKLIKADAVVSILRQRIAALIDGSYEYNKRADEVDNTTGYINKDVAGHLRSLADYNMMTAINLEGVVELVEELEEYATIPRNPPLST